MAWGTKWQMQFASLHGKQFTLSIMVQNYSESVEQLMGGPKPFTTKEDDDEDIFKAVRKQVGHLRIMTNDTTLLGRLMPDNNLDRLIKLEEIQGNDSVVRWVGFLQCQVFDQPWMNGYRLLDFPVNGIVASLDNVKMTEEMQSMVAPICQIIGSALTQLFGDAASASSMVKGICSVGSMDNNVWLKWNMMYSLFYEEETDMSSEVIVNESQSISYLDILEKICTTLGMTLREVGGYLYFADYTSTVEAGDDFTLLEIYTVASMISGSPALSDRNPCESVEMLQAISLPMGNEPTQSIMPGRNMVQVKIELDDSDNTLLYLPVTEQTDDPLNSIELHYEDELLWQPHERSNARETFNYLHYRWDNSISNWSRTGAGTYQYTVNNLMENSPLNMYTGCFGVRWVIVDYDDYHHPVLTNGLMLAMQYGIQPSSKTDTQGIIYSISSNMGINATEGYLNIKMSMFGWIYPPEWRPIEKKIERFYIALRVGDYTWNGTEWVTGALQLFSISVEDGKIVSNWSSSMNVDEEEGYFIPVRSTIPSGTLTLSIIDYCSPHQVVYPSILFGMIIDSMEVNLLYPNDITVNDQSTNNYSRILSLHGFSESKTIESNVGTFNNNKFSKSFFITPNGLPGNWVETANYTLLGEPVAIRPEVHLLQRMAAYYAVRRQLLQQKCDMRPDGESTDLQEEANIGCLLYQYNDKLFCAIDAEHDWRNDTQRIQFIEVKDVQQSS